MRSITLLGVLSVVAGLALSCGGDSNNVDAPAGAIDSPPGTIDSPPGTIDSPAGTIDSATGGTDASIGVQCGAGMCDPTTQECCVEAGGSPTCVDEGTCNGVTLTCDGPEDCEMAGDACCAVGGGGGGTTECRPPGGGCGAELCHTADDCSTPGDMCCPSPVGGVSACFDVCPP